jgi:hypothetical protein
MTSPFFIEQRRGIHFCIPLLYEQLVYGVLNFTASVHLRLQNGHDGHQLVSAGIFIVCHGHGSVDQVGQF